MTARVYPQGTPLVPRSTPHRVAIVQDPSGKPQSAVADMEQHRWTCWSEHLRGQNCHTPTGWITEENKLGKNRTAELANNSRGEPTGLKQHNMLHKAYMDNKSQLLYPTGLYKKGVLVETWSLKQWTSRGVPQANTQGTVTPSRVCTKGS